MVGWGRSIRVGVLTVSVFAAVDSWANAVKIIPSVTPNRVRDGRAVTFQLKAEFSGRVPGVQARLPVMTDWEIVNFYPGDSMTSRINPQGQIVPVTIYVYSWVLRPLRTGDLPIPAVELRSGGRRWLSEPLIVKVESLPSGAQQRDRLGIQTPQGLPNNFGRPSRPLDPLAGIPPAPVEDEGDQLPYSNFPASKVGTRESFFLSVQPSKTRAYVGEMIELSYQLYRRTHNVGTPEIKKFPDFKGFLKEELRLPKQLVLQPIQIGMETWSRGEILAYAVFPIKSGRLTIEPMEIRAEVLQRVSPEALQDMLPDQAWDAMGLGGARVIPMVKSSESVTLEVMPLPTAPADAVFTGGVGRFSLKIEKPTGSIQAQQPFSLKLIVEGRGNVKGIEEIPLGLPEGFELADVKNSAQFESDASGRKVFDYVIVPRAAGQFVVPTIKWTSFDPKTGQYVSHQIESFGLEVQAASASASSSDPAEKQPQVLRLQPLGVELGEWVPHKGRISWLWWVIVGAWLIALTLWIRDKRSSRLRAFLTAHPWEKTEIDLAQMGNSVGRKVAEKVDLWTRERLTGHLQPYLKSRQVQGEFHGESYNEDFLVALSSLGLAEAALSELRDLWTELDDMRFTGNRKKQDQMMPAGPLLQKAKTTLSKLAAMLPLAVELDVDEDSE